MRGGVLFLLLCLVVSVMAQSVPLSQYNCLQWRCIGPFRGGRTVGIDLVWSKPSVWYIGVNNGGVWKSTDYGHTWNSVFDDQPTGSVGCLGIAQSRPDTVYVGSGEGLQRPDLSVGDGIYKTTDGGKTWKNTGLSDGQQVSGISVDPKDPDRVFVAVLGHPYGPNKTRGVYRTTDGGKSWQPVLQIDENTGAAAVAIDPVDPQTVYADMWAARQGPWENGEWQGTTSGLFKSTDGGATWKKLGGGLPTVADKVGRIGFSICKANNKRIYATVDSPTKGGLYRSDDAGASWTHVATEPRLWGRGGDFAEVRVDPTDPDKVYVANTSTYRSTNGGKDWVCIKGAPGGDDYHTIVIHPTQPDIIGLAADQGATISVNAGETWSSWYNQPTAQFYHVSTDNAFPYRVYGGQQESGSAGVASRGPDGQITFRDWRPVGAEEYAYVAPDPLDPNIIYGNKGTKFDWRTFKVENIRPKFEGMRFIRTMPLIFSPKDPKVLFQAAQWLLRTTNGGETWEKVSPDLTRASWDVPPSFGAVSDQGKTMKQRGVIYAVAPSPLDVGIIWCGTDDGLVWLTRDGGVHWTDVTPKGVTSWSKVSQIDAGHFEAGTAYVSVNRLRCDDLKPYVYVTHDFGATWRLAVGGLDENPVNAVREDPVRKGLLYAATERAVWFSADDGGHWNPLRLNMPASSIRDIVVKDDDLVVGTHGRSFWICDQVNVLRHLGEVLVPPSVGYQVENNLNTDTPLPPEEPAGKNPPDGVCIDYVLPASAKVVTLEFVDSAGKVARSFSSEDKQVPLNPKAITVDPRWARPLVGLGTVAGAHRFVWDLRLAASGRGLSMQAIWFDTPLSKGAFVTPGAYMVRLTVDGVRHEQPLAVRADPRSDKAHYRWTEAFDDPD
ncbi:MAG: glycoside hydrolase [Armatimonadetes bacterium]|nr:glycoside hydrolase [Armatimonadota bacterium]